MNLILILIAGALAAAGLIQSPTFNGLDLLALIPLTIAIVRVIR